MGCLEGRRGFRLGVYTCRCILYIYICIYVSIHRYTLHAGGLWSSGQQNYQLDFSKSSPWDSRNVLQDFYFELSYSEYMYIDSRPTLISVGRGYGKGKLYSCFPFHSFCLHFFVDTPRISVVAPEYRIGILRNSASRVLIRAETPMTVVGLSSVGTALIDPCVVWTS